MILSDLAKYAMTPSVAYLSATAELIVRALVHLTPQLGGPRRNIAITMEKLEWCGYT